MIKNTANQAISAALINKTTGAPVTSGTTTVYVTIDGGTQAAGQGTVEHEGLGQWTYKPTQAETNGNSLAFLFVNSSAVTVNLQVYTETAASVAQEEAEAAANAYDLLTLSELRLFPGISSLPITQNAILQALITAATLDFEAYWQTYGVRRGASQVITYRQIVRDSPAANILRLEKQPIQSVVSIADPAGNTIDSDDYWIDPMAGLRTTGGWTIPQDSQGFETYWTVTYSGGWVANTAAVPANIKAACKIWTASLFKRADRDVISKRVGDLALTYAQTQDKAGLPEYLKHMISQWRILGV